MFRSLYFRARYFAARYFGHPGLFGGDSICGSVNVRATIGGAITGTAMIDGQTQVTGSIEGTINTNCRC